MPLLMECDMCGRVDREYDSKKKICSNCEAIVSKADAEAFKAMQVKFEAHISAQVSILNLMQYLMAEKRTHFEQSFGIKGIELLERALKGVDSS